MHQANLMATHSRLAAVRQAPGCTPRAITIRLSATRPRHTATVRAFRDDPGHRNNFSSHSTPGSASRKTTNVDLDSLERQALDMQRSSNRFMSDLKQQWDNVDNKAGFTAYAAASILLVYLSSAVLNSVDRLPLLPGLFKLVGCIYSGWFVWRYLLFKPGRGDLADLLHDVQRRLDDKAHDVEVQGHDIADAAQDVLKAVDRRLEKAVDQAAFWRDGGGGGGHPTDAAAGAAAADHDDPSAAPPGGTHGHSAAATGTAAGTAAGSKQKGAAGGSAAASGGRRGPSQMTVDLSHLRDKDPGNTAINVKRADVGGHALPGQGPQGPQGQGQDPLHGLAGGGRPLAPHERGGAGGEPGTAAGERRGGPGKAPPPPAPWTSVSPPPGPGGRE